MWYPDCARLFFWFLGPILVGAVKAFIPLCFYTSPSTIARAPWLWLALFVTKRVRHAVESPLLCWTRPNFIQCMGARGLISCLYSGTMPLISRNLIIAVFAG